MLEFLHWVSTTHPPWKLKDRELLKFANVFPGKTKTLINSRCSSPVSSIPCSCFSTSSDPEPEVFLRDRSRTEDDKIYKPREHRENFEEVLTSATLHNCGSGRCVTGNCLICHEDYSDLYSHFHKKLRNRVSPKVGALNQMQVCKCGVTSRHMSRHWRHYCSSFRFSRFTTSGADIVFKCIPGIIWQ